MCYLSVEVRGLLYGVTFAIYLYVGSGDQIQVARLAWQAFRAEALPWHNLPCFMRWASH